MSKSTRIVELPLALANKIQSELNTSIISALMYLATVAKTAADNASDGNTAVEKPSHPATGNHLNLTANTYCKSTASTKDGTDCNN